MIDCPYDVEVDVSSQCVEIDEGVPCSEASGHITLTRRAIEGMLLALDNGGEG